MPEPAQTLAAALLEPEIVSATDLGGSERSHVLRLELADGTSAVVKHFVTASSEEGFRRELTGLRYLPRTPRLLASKESERLLVMSDVGSGDTLADLLLANDSDAAWSGAVSWAGALGDVAGRAARHVKTARDELATVSGTFNPNAAIQDGLNALIELTGLHPAGLDAELDAINALLKPSDADVLWPGDTCPDNAVSGENGWTFLDLEGTEVNHAALVAAYPALPFATCWCVFNPPADLTDQMVAAFTLALSAHQPQITDRPQWRHEIDLGCAAWVLAATGWLMTRALEGDAPIGPSEFPSPTRRQLLTSRWTWTARQLPTALPALAELAAAAVAWAEQNWTEDAQPLRPYPAFDVEKAAE